MAKSRTAELRPPDQAEREYVRLLTWYTNRIAAETRKILMPKLGELSRRGEVQTDSYVDDIAVIMLALADAIALHGSVVEARLPSIFALMARNNDRALILAVKAATGQTLPPAIAGARPSILGVNLYRGEPWIKNMQEGWVRQNVSLVKSIATQHHDRLTTIVQNGVFEGQSVRQLSAQIEDQFGVSRKRATLIAQDQILGANARVTQIRAEALGVKQYVWATVGDSRVRPEHVDLNGKTFSWNKPPREGHPGTPIRCRCRAALVLPEFD